MMNSAASRASSQHISLRGDAGTRDFQYRYGLSKRGLDYVGWLDRGNLPKTALGGHLVEASGRYLLFALLALVLNEFLGDFLMWAIFQIISSIV